MSGSGERPIYAFEGFRLDAQHRVLSRAGGEPIPLAPKVFDTLLCFVEHQGELLGKRVLLDAIWPHVIVEENNLNQAISTLRRVLGEKPGDHRFIATEPGRGYRFLAAVREIPAAQRGDTFDPPAGAPPSGDNSVRAAKGFGRNRLLAIAASIAVVSLLVVIQRYGLTDDAAQAVITSEPVAASQAASSAAPANSIAVLPFVNLSPDRENEYFSDGLSEELLSKLAQRADLQVTARSSSFAFKGSDRSVQEIARVLGVARVLEGSVRREGNQLRITAQLISAADGYSLWSATYDREIGELFAIQEDIAARVAGSLTDPFEVAPSGSGLGGTDIIEAYELYVASLAHFARSTRDSNVHSRRFLDAAIELDSRFAMAWARKSMSHANAMVHFPADIAAHKDEALHAAQRAIDLEPKLGLGHAALGQILSVEPSFVKAEEEYRTAIELGVRVSEIPSYGILQLAVGNVEKGREVFQKARVTDPLNPTLLAFLLGSHHMVGDAAAALAEYKRATTVHSNHRFQRFMATAALLSTGEVESPNELPLEADPIDEAAAAHFHEPEQALEQLHVLYADERYADMFNRRRFAMWAAYFGDPDFALSAVKDATENMAMNGFELWFPLFAEARQRPAFKDLVRDLGILAHWRVYGWPQNCRPSGADDFECT